MPNAIIWRIPPTVVSGSMIKYGLRTMAAVTALAQIIASEAERDMKNNAPWTDHTAHARSNLRGMAEQASTEMVIIYLITGADYGKWLELRWGGRYAVIMPTIERMIPDIKRRLDQLLR